MTKEELLNSGLPGVVCLVIGEHDISAILRILHYKTKWPDRDFVLVNITGLPYDCTDIKLNNWAKLSNVPVVDIDAVDMWNYASVFLVYSKSHDETIGDMTHCILNYCLDLNDGNADKRFALFYI